MPVADLVLIGLATTLEPLPITGFILVLSAERGPLKGAAFILGWFLSLAVVVVATVAVTGGNPPRPATVPSNTVLGIKIAIGIGLVGVAVHRRRRVARPPRPPAWMAGLDRMGVWPAAGIGVLLQPWGLVAVGAATVAQLHVSSAESFLLLAGFCLLATASLLVMELATVVSPDATQARLSALRSWIDTHRDQAIIVLSLVLGLWLVGDSLYLVVSG